VEVVASEASRTMESEPASTTGGKVMWAPTELGVADRPQHLHDPGPHDAEVDNLTKGGNTHGALRPVPTNRLDVFSGNKRPNSLLGNLRHSCALNASFSQRHEIIVAELYFRTEP
jgi:hypothetical protein